jgi:cell division protein FtsZ
VIGSASAKRDEPASSRTDSPRSSGLGTVPVREEPPVAAEPAPSAGELGSAGGSAQVPSARPYDTQAEELDVPDFLK